MNQLTDDTKQIPKTGSGNASPDDLDIQVKPVDVSQYNTINLQKELAESMRELLENKTEEIPAGQVNDLMMTQMYAPVEQEEGAEEPAQVEKSAEDIQIPDMQPVEPEEVETQEAVQEQETASGAAQEPSTETVSEEFFEQSEEPQKEPEEPVLRQDTDEMKLITDADLKQADEEVFFGNTSEVNVQDVVSSSAFATPD